MLLRRRFCYERIRAHLLVPYVLHVCARAHLENMSWHTRDVGNTVTRSYALVTSIIAIKTRLFRLRLFHFDDTDSAVAAHVGVAHFLPFDARPGLKLIA